MVRKSAIVATGHLRCLLAIAAKNEASDDGHVSTDMDMVSCFER